MKNNTKVVGQIYSTMDYSIFKKMKGNREIYNSPKLREDLLENGQQLPIVVNNKMEVMDGQHRLKELKSLNLPVVFIVKDDYKVTNVISINNTQRNWRDISYLNFYAEHGNENYIRLKEFYNKNTLPLTLCITAGSGLRQGTLNRAKKTFREGKFIFNNETQLAEYSLFLEKLELEAKYKLNNNEMDMLWTLYTSKNFNSERMINKFITKNLKSELFGIKDKPSTLRILLTAYIDRLQKGSEHYIGHSYNSKGDLLIEGGSK